MIVRIIAIKHWNDKTANVLIIRVLIFNKYKGKRYCF